MKFLRLFSILISAMFILTLAVGCGEEGEASSDDSSKGKTESAVGGNVASKEETTSKDTATSSENTSSEVETDSSVTATTSSSVSSVESNPVVETVPLQKLGAISGNGTLYKFDDNLYKLEVPFENIYTSVFFLKLDSGEWFIIDAATTSSDVISYVSPAAKALNVNMQKVKGILLTHSHADHAGGLPTLASLCPNAVVYGVKSTASTGSNKYSVVQDETVLFNTIKVVTLKGHDQDACGYIDLRSKTIMTGDSIQLFGVGNYGCQIYAGVDTYYSSIEKLTGKVNAGQVENILISHKYVPLGAYAIGKESSLNYLHVAKECVDELKDYTKGMYDSGVTNEQEIQRYFIEFKKAQYPDFPVNNFTHAIKSIINLYCR